MCQISIPDSNKTVYYVLILGEFQWRNSFCTATSKLREEVRVRGGAYKRNRKWLFMVVVE